MSFSDSIVDFGKGLFHKSIEIGNIAKLKYEIATLESSVSKSDKKIGEILRKSGIHIENLEINDLIAKIEAMNSEINEKKEKINEIKEHREENGTN